jgi:hypothetical protein
MVFVVDCLQVDDCVVCVCFFFFEFLFTVYRERSIIKTTLLSFSFLHLKAKNGGKPVLRDGAMAFTKVASPSLYISSSLVKENNLN